jgi:(4-(4-[2-(gamma-L-glutamylamino)ethyl]phenoxymethyl)furan-2-yl)methanamine synthase
MSWLGLDIGGANLKAANAQGWACSKPFALWREPQTLAAELAEFINIAPAWDRLAVTMAGELCDCFCSKAEGVQHILNAVEHVAGGRQVRVYLVDGRFATINDAKASPRLAAASNWYALATYAARYERTGAGLLIDVGSTTTDVIPIRNGKVVARGHTDTERLLSGELLYQGIGRTAVCAVTHALLLGDELCPVASEVFATTADAYLLVGYLEEDSVATWTADGRALTRENAKRRLARQICADVDDIPDDGYQVMAGAIVDALRNRLGEAVERVARRCGSRDLTYVLSGVGEAIARRSLEQTGTTLGTLSLTETFGSTLSRSATAFAIAVLAEEAFG